MELKMKFKNPNIKPLLMTNGKLLGNPSELKLTGCLDESQKIDLEYLNWLILNDTADSFYKLYRWVKFREKIIERDKHECQLCKSQGVLTVVRSRAYVHHIAEFKLFPQYCLNANNLVTLCHKCHELTHDRTYVNEPKELDFKNFDAVERW